MVKKKKKSTYTAGAAGDPGLIPGLGRAPWRRKWQLTPVLLPGESHGRRSLISYSPWNFPVKNTEVGCHFLLQGIYPTQGSPTLVGRSFYHWVTLLLQPSAPECTALTFIDCLLCAKLSALYVLSCKDKQQLTEVELFSFYRWRNWDLSNLPPNRQLVSVRTGLQPTPVWLHWHLSDCTAFRSPWALFVWLSLCCFSR